MNSEEKESKEEVEEVPDSQDSSSLNNKSSNPYVIIMEGESEIQTPPSFTNSFFLQPLLNFLDLHNFSSYSSYSSFIDESVYQDVVSESMDSYWSELNRQDPTRILIFKRLGEECEHDHKEIRYDPKHHNLEKCFVCLELFIESEILILLFPCGHLFHVDCIQRAVQFQTKCPLCRLEIRVDATTLVRN